MKVKCPACGAVASLDALLSHDGAREAVLVALQLPAPLGKRLIQYLGLFRPVTRELSFDRLATLLGELVEPLQNHRFNRGGRDWGFTNEMMAAALQDMLDRRDAGKLTLPLKSHGYLWEVLVGMCDKQEGRKENAREDQRRFAPSGWRRTTGPVSAAEVAGGVIPTTEARQRGLQAMRDALNKTNSQE